MAGIEGRETRLGCEVVDAGGVLIGEEDLEDPKKRELIKLTIIKTYQQA